VSLLVNSYSAQPQGRSPGRVILAMFRNLRRSRYVAYRLARKDIQGERTKSRFATLWDFLDPLVLAVIFYILQSVRVINPGDIHIPYAVFVTFGLLLFQTFSESVTLPMDVIRRSRHMLAHLKLTPEALILSTLFRILFNSSFRIGAMLLIALAMSSLSWVGFLKFLLLFPSIILAGMAFGLILAPFHTLYNDVGRVAKIILLPLRYASPVLYTIPDIVPFVYLQIFNPVANILSNLRSVATQNVFVDLSGFGIWLAILSTLFFLGWFLFHLAAPLVAERA
jgi:lipopolysaccharide transport system permease protein